MARLVYFSYSRFFLFLLLSSFLCFFRLFSFFVLTNSVLRHFLSISLFSIFRRPYLLFVSYIFLCFGSYFLLSSILIFLVHSLPSSFPFSLSSLSLFFALSSLPIFLITCSVQFILSFLFLSLSFIHLSTISLSLFLFLSKLKQRASSVHCCIMWISCLREQDSGLALP